MTPFPFLKNSMAGRFKLTVRRADGSVKHDLPWFDNLILTAGLNQIGFGAIGTYVSVGSGSTAPVAGNTALQAFVATTANQRNHTSGAISVSPYYGWTRRTWRFNPGEATGNLSEVGVGWGDGLFSRALILDSGGAPTTITVLADEVLDVTYELRLYPPLTDSTFNVTIAGVVYACRRRASAVGSTAWSPHFLFDYGAVAYVAFSYDGDIGSLAEYPSGTSWTASTEGLAYSNNSKLALSKNTWPLDGGNYEGGIKSIHLAQTYPALGAYQISFTPPIPKDNTKILTLTTQVSWDRHTPA